MINFGVIGTGWITDSWIACAHATQKWSLTSVYSRNAETASSFARKYNVTKTHSSIDSLASDADIQAVYIASPNSLHYQQAKQLLSAKKHVILEKPAASNSRELDDLFATAKANNVFLIEAFRHIQEVNFKILKKNTVEKLGPIYGASLNYASYSSRYDKVLAGETPNIFSLDFNGGSLVDLAVYPICAAIALFGTPDSATYKPFIITTGADGGGHIILRYPKFGVSINASKIYTSTAPSEIYGEKGTLVVNAITDIDSVRFIDAKKKSSAEELAEKKKELNLQEEAEFYAEILKKGDKGAAQELEDISRGVVKITESLRKENGLIFPCEKCT